MKSDRGNSYGQYEKPLEGNTVSKRPDDDNPSIAGVSHFSSRQHRGRKNGHHRAASKQFAKAAKSLSEDGLAIPAPTSERDRSVEQIGSVLSDHFTGQPLAQSERPVGYGFDAKAGQHKAVNSNGGASANKNRRPGRSRVNYSKSVEFPPKPNRQRRGLAPVPRQKSGPDGKFTNSGRAFDSARHRQQLTPLYAALDLGTNNCRLLVALPQQTGRFRIVDAFSRIVRLGKGMEASGSLEKNAMDRALDALAICAKKLQNSNIRKMRLIATEACRRADNGDDFLRRVKQETGLDLEVVNRQTEAYLAAEGCGALVDRKADAAVLFDIGGGSSELILLDRRERKKRPVSKQISAWTSLPVGVVTLSERHGGRNVSRQAFEAMVAEVEKHLEKFEGRETLAEIWTKGRVHLLGTSGTVTTLAGLHLNLKRYDRRQVDGIWLDDVQVDNVIDRLIEMEYHQRAANACIGSERADLVLAGCAILQAIRNTWPSPRLRVADRGLREGILTQLINQDGAWIPSKKRRRVRKNTKGKTLPMTENGASGINGAKTNG